MPSAVIRRYEYDETQNRLTITFVSGKVYAYHLVPRDVVRDFKDARSKGSFFNQFIRDRFPCREIEGSGNA